MPRLVRLGLVCLVHIVILVVYIIGKRGEQNYNQGKSRGLGKGLQKVMTPIMSPMHSICKKTLCDQNDFVGSLVIGEFRIALKNHG